MKILHCSDIHLGKRPLGGIGDFSKKRYEDYFISFNKIAEEAIVSNIDVMLISGDFFDKKNISPEVLEKTEVILKKLHGNKIQILLIEGNHDNIIKGSESGSWIVYLENKNLVKRLSYRVEKEEDNKVYNFDKEMIKGINFYGLGYPGIMVDEVMTELALQLNSNEKNIIMVHTAISENDFLPGTVKRDTVSKFKDKAIYIAGGHFHSYTAYPKDEPYFFISGSSEYWNILNEKKQKKGYIIFDTETKEHCFHALETRKQIYLPLDIEAKDQEEFREELSLKIEEMKIEKNEDIVIVDLKPKNNFYINIEECEKLLLDKGALKAYVSVKYPILNEVNLDSDLLSIEHIEKSIIEQEWAEFSGKADKTAEFLKNLKEFQRSGENELFADTFNSMLETIMGEDNSENK